MQAQRDREWCLRCLPIAAAPILKRTRRLLKWSVVEDGSDTAPQTTPEQHLTLELRRDWDTSWRAAEIVRRCALFTTWRPSSIDFGRHDAIDDRGQSIANGNSPGCLNLRKRPITCAINTPMRRTRSRCCAPAASGHAVAPPRSVMNSRLFTRSPRRRGRAASGAPRGRALSPF